MTQIASRYAAGCDVLRVMTYNVHSCTGTDRKLSIRRIAQVIQSHAPDVVALQELDVRRARTNGVDQARAIADQLEMDSHFHPALRIDDELYGNAVLSHLPMRLVSAGALPGHPEKTHLEPRGALWVAVELNQGGELQLINTHLGLRRRERLAQVKALLGPQWLGHPDCVGPVALCGDLNALRSSAVCGLLGERLTDVELHTEGRAKGTWASRYPFLRIDHIFIDDSIEVIGIEVSRNEMARVASDHLPLVASLRVR